MSYLFGHDRSLFHRNGSARSRGFDNISWHFDCSRYSFHDRSVDSRSFFNHRSSFNDFSSHHVDSRSGDNGNFRLCWHHDLSDSVNNRASGYIGLSCFNLGSSLLGSFFSNGFDNHMLGQCCRGLQSSSDGFSARDGNNRHYRLFNLRFGNICLGCGGQSGGILLFFVTLAAGIFVDALAALTFDTLLAARSAA
jgi:hypothetical protein